VNPPDALVCRECGTSLESPYVTPAAAPDDTVVVARAGMSQSEIAVMVLCALVAVIAIGLLMYQWGRANNTDDELANERAARSAETQPAPAPATAPAPVTAPVIVPPASAPPVTVNVPPIPGNATASQPSGCASYGAQVDPILDDWTTQLATAEASTGTDLNESIGHLQDLQRRASRISAPACASRAHSHLLTAMTATIDALRSSARTGEAASDSTAFQHAEELFDKFQTEYSELKTAA
jgi:hypothetical protein